MLKVMSKNRMKSNLFVFVIIFFVGFNNTVYAQDLNQCNAYLKNDTLTIENGTVFQKFLWNKGNLIHLAFGSQSSKRSVISPDDKPVFKNGKTYLEPTGDGQFQVTEQPNTSLTKAFLKVDVTCLIGKLEIRRTFRIFPFCPAIGCDLYLKGEIVANSTKSAFLGDLKSIENDEAKLQGVTEVAVTERIRLLGSQWKAKSVEFFDITDRNNTLVQTYDRLAYRQESQMRGNLLLLKNITSGQQIFLLKEAPTSSVQLYYPGYDFTVARDEVKVVGFGVAPSNLNDSTWIRAYGTVIGLSLSNSELGILSAVRQYQQTKRIHQSGRDEMIMMNTWGDRSQDTKVNNAFCLKELEAGARLGISHFQLDDGWQTGRSGNSKFQGGSFENIWRNPNYWKPDPQKFPDGLANLAERGKELGIRICLWFNPSSDHSNANWENDADALIGLYKEHGIKTFKIDGVKLDDKKAEINFRKMLDKVVAATGGEVVFNLDVTAQRRGGYNFLNEYGTIFLENRYTDFQNYYPFWTLRNLWMLSKYIPAQNLQIEFLNIWRNQNKYADDPFRPANYSFDYVFAITMMAQPLAWFEATALPPGAFKSAGLIKGYKAIQSDIHKGTILPIGKEPDGICWTGFQSIQGNNGYFLVFREAGAEKFDLVKTWLMPGVSVKCQPVLGSGKPFTAKTDTEGNLQFELDKPNSFALYKYNIE